MVVLERLSSRVSSRVTSDGGTVRSLASSEVLSSLDYQVTKLVTFSGSEHLLRGVPLYRVLRYGARVFASSTGSESTYRWSMPVSRINAFLSHNWDVSRGSKFAVFLFFFNVPLSAVAMLFATAVLAPLTLTGHLPVIVAEGSSYGSGIYCRMLFFPFVLLFTVFLRDLLYFLRRTGPVVFLDKVCIQQGDQQNQKFAIEKLGAFLAKSDTMVVAYTGLYLQRLWTVYEVASFLVLHPVSDMHIVPVSQAVLFFAAWICVYLANVIFVVVRAYTSAFVRSETLLHGAIRCVGGLAVCRAMRSWARERVAIQMRLKTFSVRDCMCTVESDRQIVYGNIARLMVASHRAPLDASEEVALDAFDKLVHNKLPSAFESALGGTTFDYKTWLAICAVDVAPTCLDQLAGASAGMRLQEALAIVSYFAVWLFTMWPLSGLVLECFARRGLALTGCWQWAYILFFLLSSGVVLGVVSELLHWLQVAAGTSPVALAGYVFLNILSATGTCAATTRCYKQPQNLLQDSAAGSAAEAIHPSADCIGCALEERESVPGLPTVRLVRI